MNKLERLKRSYELMNVAFERYKRKVRTNNWLKMHHEPKRRRGA